VSALDALRVPGSVSFGGTDLGLIRDVQLLRTASQTPIEAEEFGIEIVDELFVGAVYRVGLALRGFLSTSIAAVFPNVSAGFVQFPGAKKAGWFRSQDAAALVFTPKDSNYPGFTFAMAIPRAAEEVEVSMAARTEHLILCEFLAIREGAAPTGSVSWGL